MLGGIQDVRHGMYEYKSVMALYMQHRLLCDLIVL
jgi:hypothetical protein